MCAALTVDRLSPLIGILKEILTDQSTSLMFHTLRELYEFLCIMSILTSGYHPKTDGLLKELNKTLKPTIHKFISDDENY